MRQGLHLMRRYLNISKNGMVRSLSNAPPEMDLGVSSEIDKVRAGKHLKITAASTRQPVIAEAMVTEIKMESPAVRGITLKVDHPNFNFKAGQWIDMFIPGIETVGGFSMYSSPAQLAEKRTLELGIKFSKWPPAFWIHNQCKVGSSVAIRVGGDFYFAPEIGDPSHDLLLIAGGVGLNPLASIFSHACHLYKLHQENSEEYCPGKIKLLYSAKTYEDLLYKKVLDAICSDIPNVEVQYFTTRSMPPESSNVKYGRITQEDLKTAVKSLDMSLLKTFICGPPPMIEKMNENLLAVGLSQNQLIYEKWW
ncbi:oxidoreductase NAD-binding domain-containing protein 1-like [Penaeus japonicus]|uniref:oxidoreductase NAD-binding domain-containing protein 1-like n=1 Tax=Penaeus japonicus TaxID=27405 RepID=UPI001C711F70|nr:oxidoreductase NAD-binding domain-containing protein 1-like [Penaeus japonicus]